VCAFRESRQRLRSRPQPLEPQRRFSRELQLLAGAASINRCAFGRYDEVNSRRRDTVHSEFELSPALSSSVLIRLIRLTLQPRMSQDARMEALRH
jgi:hypothetical protein